MFNSSGAVISMESENGATGEIMLQAGGRFVAWCASKPSSFMVDEEPFDYTFDASSGALEAVIPGDGWASVRVTL